MNKKPIVWLFVLFAVILGAIFIGLSVYYFVTPASLLPSLMPGFEAGSTHIHIKHAIASLILGLALFVLAWFKSGKSNDENGPENHDDIIESSSLQ